MNLPKEPRTPALLQTLHLIAQPTRFLESCAKQIALRLEVWTAVATTGETPATHCLSYTN
ncbi:hypothetical protein [Chroococcidiopsis sp. CCMEE 29]|uniref:hypothetical protein n=1 Tax=Chroococcidiopsis sp. CCMEE 29 TaxID=155894 RepID=UPI0020213D3F|nr:hypothetical protein [Chroococcidiopsis sp. CCMEE 29]